MLLSDILRAMGRRWYVLLAGLLVTAGLGVAATVVSPPEYSARGLVLLLPPSEVVGPGGNPFLELSGLGLPASILVAYFQSEVVQQQVEDISPDAKFEVLIEESTRGPLLAIEVTDTTPEGTLDTLNFLADQIPENLKRLQVEVAAPEKSLVTSMPLTIDTKAEEDATAGNRLMFLAVGAGLLGTIFLTYGVDRLILRRRARKAERAAQDADATADPDDAGDAEPVADDPDGGGVDEAASDAGEADDGEGVDEPAADAEEADDGRADTDRDADGDSDGDSDGDDPDETRDVPLFVASDEEHVR